MNGPRRRQVVTVGPFRCGRLVRLCLLSFLVGGCEERDAEKPLSAPKARNQAIIAEPGSVTAAEAKTAASVAPLPPPKAARELCAGQWEKPGKALSTHKLERAAAAGVSLPSERMETGSGYTWVNFWAAWCVPCREEIPLLMSWEKKLGGTKPGFKLVFVSLDDDERQLKQFLEAQPADGLRSTYWLREGAPREEWFKAIDADPDPELPVHVLLDPSGKARCVVNGAVKESDFAVLKNLLRGSG